ncbi:uncharacterized protein LOC6534183 [Drosophila yakuba]|uniref:Uncharacterized protein n=1 Tax=Drosophila yakuba TaxID=7245 RepID=B4PIY7_DROYA|nr:uncharacterized protein LOC6534183 [Drosophila yakuba]EDW94578.1 uncharacterized protein Dyak_GE19974 [Drosophila yakuba]
MSSEDEDSRVERRFCAIGNHTLRKPFRELNNKYLVHFAWRLNSEIRVGQLICCKCYTHLVRLYRKKNDNAKQHKMARENAASVTDVSGSQFSQQSAITSATAGTAAQESQNSSQSSDFGASYSQGVVTADGVMGSSGNSSHESDNVPTTSAAAIRKRQLARTNNTAKPTQRKSLALTTPDSDDYDPNSNLSLNAVNGTRLPHIQPIPKRRPTVLDQPFMDIYLQGTTGG